MTRIKLNQMLLHKPTGRIFSTKDEAKAILGIGETKFKAKAKTGEIFFISTDYSNPNSNQYANHSVSSSVKKVYEKLHTIE